MFQHSCYFFFAYPMNITPKNPGEKRVEGTLVIVLKTGT